MKKFLSCLICLLFVICFIFAGCFDPNTVGGTNETDATKGESGEEVIKYTLISTLDKSVIENFYSSVSTIYPSDNGAVTIVLNNPSVSAGFRWDLSDYSFATNVEYRVEFENLVISGFEPDLWLVLKLQWKDMSYTYLRYYHTDTGTFSTSVDNDHYGLHLESLTYETYSFSFKFSHSGVDSSDIKKLYLDFQGIEAGGTLSFDSLSIYVRQ